MTDMMGNTPADLPRSYYDFARDISKGRMITYWYQLQEISAFAPGRMLEIGKGSGLVAGAAKAFGLDVTTVDINSDLKPDYCASVLDLPSELKESPFDVVLCARVLHHLDFSEFENALISLARVSKHLVLTLPRDDFRIYFSIRLTSREPRMLSLRVPLALKRLISRVMGQSNTYYAKLWKIDSRAETKLENIRMIISRHFKIVKDYDIPEDRAHHVFVLKTAETFEKG